MREIYKDLFFLMMTVFVLAVGLVGCSKSQTPAADRQQASTPRATAAPISPVIEPSQPLPITARAESGSGKTDACALLASKEIQSIQGESLKETKSTARSEGGFNLAQCFFVLPTFTNSISVAVTRRGDGRDARDPKEFWKERFHSKKDSETRGGTREKDRDQDPDKRRAEEKEEAVPPRRISGVGDEAFWTGGALGGALYVLKGNAFVRVSIGGAGDQRTKTNRSKALAQLVLQHL